MQRNKKPVSLAKLNIKPVLVDDPYEIAAKVVVLKNVSTTPLDGMYHQGRLDAVQYEAGNKFQRIFEREMIGGARAIDYSMERVDGGRLADPLSDSLLQAHRDLMVAANAAGIVGYQILRAVIGEGISIRRLIKERPSLCMGLEGRRAEGYVGGRLVEALDAIVDAWGMTARGKRKASTKEHSLFSHEATSGAQVEYVVGKLGHLVPVEKQPKREEQAPQKVMKKNRKPRDKALAKV